MLRASASRSICPCGRWRRTDAALASLPQARKRFSGRHARSSPLNFPRPSGASKLRQTKATHIILPPYHRLRAVPAHQRPGRCYSLDGDGDGGHGDAVETPTEVWLAARQSRSRAASRGCFAIVLPARARLAAMSVSAVCIACVARCWPCLHVAMLPFQAPTLLLDHARASTPTSCLAATALQFA